MQTCLLVKIEILLFTWLFVSVQSLTHVQVSFCYSRKILFYKSGRWCKDWFCPLFSLKLASAIFYHIFIFHQMKNVEKWKLWKMFFISSKKLFSFLRYSNYVFPSSPLFFPVSHCFRGWSNKNLKVYDIINCLNTDFITHFVWYHEKEIRCDIETLTIDRVLNKEHFYGGLSKSLEKVNFISSFELSPFNGQSYQVQKGSETSEQSLFRSQNKSKKTPLFVIYYMTKFDDVM